MAKSKNIQEDLEVFIEYQQILKEKEIVSNPEAKEQVHSIYKDLMHTKEGKNLIDKHNDFKNSVNLSTEKAFLKDNLGELIKQSPENKAIQRSAIIRGEDFNTKIKSDVKDMATSLTSNEVHPWLKQNPDKLRHATGVMARISALNLERSNSLAKQLGEMKSKLTNLMGNLLNQGNSQEQIKDFMNNPAPSPKIEKKTNKTTQQQLGH